MCNSLCCLGAIALFYTDDPDVTEPHVLHFEFFNEFDGLQSAQFPNLNQNTANFRFWFNYGLPYGLELDVDAPYISIYRDGGAQTSSGLGDTDMGIKWNFRKAHGNSSCSGVGKPASILNFRNR